MKSQKITYSEEDLVSGLKNHDTTAIKALYAMYSGALLGVITRLVQHPGISEDLLQEVLIKIWYSSEKYDSSKGRLFTWMINLAKNYTIDVLRSKQYRNNKKNINVDDCHQVIDIIHQVPYNPDTVLIKELIFGLKPEFNVLLDMVYFKGYTHVAIADELNLPLGTVKTRLRMAIAELRNHFD